MANQIDITGRFIAAFGLTRARALLFPNGIYRFERYTPDTDFEDMSLIWNDQVLEFSDKLQANNVLAVPPVIRFSREKRLIITPMNGENIEVVERWNSGNWSLAMEGLLIDMEEHHYPTDKIEALERMFAFNNVIEVSGTQFTEKNISHIYTTGVDIRGLEGYQDTVRYSIRANSTREANFSLLNPNE